MRAIKWTRRNKLFAGLGGLAAALLAVFLVFTFVGMPGGGKLSGTVMTINGHQYDIKPGANLTKANLKGAALTRANLSYADLTRAFLKGANLHEAKLNGAYLLEARLNGADLTGANLNGAYLYRADLTEADLSWADLSWADLSEANLSWADLTGADLTGADLTNAIFKNTTMPDGSIGNRLVVSGVPRVVDWEMYDLYKGHYVVRDDNGLKQVELWKRVEPWPFYTLEATHQVQGTRAEGDFQIKQGMEYGIHVVDNDGNWSTERDAGLSTIMFYSSTKE